MVSALFGIGGFALVFLLVAAAHRERKRRVGEIVQNIRASGRTVNVKEIT